MTRPAIDSSGNGNDGLYSVDSPHFVAGLVPGDLACDVSPPGGCTVTLPIVPTQWNYDWTIEIWLRGTDDSFLTGQGTIYYATGDGGDLTNGVPGTDEEIQFGSEVGGITLFHGRGDSFWGVVGEGVPNDGNPHHLVLTYSPHAPAGGLIEADVSIYLDGSALTLTDEGIVSEPVGPDELKIEAFMGGIVAAAQLAAVADEFAVYPSALSSGDVSAHYAAAATSFAAYTAAVLADNPTVYYHLNDGVLAGWYVGAVAIGPS